MTDQIKLTGVRLSFPNIFQPKAVQKSEPKFAASFLLDKIKDAEQIKNLQLLIVGVAKEKFGGMDEVKKLREKNKLTFCLHEGSEKDEYDGYDDTVMYVSAASKIRPMIIDRNRAQLVEADGRPYGGCYVDAIIRVWAQDNDFGKKVNAELRGIQFVKDGEAFGAAPLDVNEFTDYSEEAGEVEEQSGKSGAQEEAERSGATPSKKTGSKKSSTASDTDEIKF